MKTKKLKNIYRFALRDLLDEMGLTQKAARAKFGFDRHGPGYISRTGFVKLCGEPKMVSIGIINILCHGMDITPGQLWKSDDKRATASG